MKIYVAEHNPLIYESVFGIISVHAKKESAIKSMNRHRKRYHKLHCGLGNELPEWTVWRVRTLNVKP